MSNHSLRHKLVETKYLREVHTELLTIDHDLMDESELNACLEKESKIVVKNMVGNLIYFKIRRDDL